MVLWPDTFTNFFSPVVGVAAVRVLRAAGFDPVLPERPGVLRADVGVDRSAVGGAAG